MHLLHSFALLLLLGVSAAHESAAAETCACAAANSSSASTGAVAAAAERQCSVSQPSESASAHAPKSPKFCLTGDGRHMGNVQEVLKLMGYEETQDPAEANVIWSWKDPFFVLEDSTDKLRAANALLPKLSRHQYINQLPGLCFLTTKPALSNLSRELDVLPKTFALPQEYDAWQAFMTTERGAGMEWIQKGRKHRGIAIIQDPSAPGLGAIKPDDGILVQQLVRPYLIDNRLWDVGVYVAVTSLEPLLAYVHTGGVLLRFCSKEYEHDITPNTDQSSYVILGLDDYLPASKVPGMEPHFRDAIKDKRFKTTLSLAALRSYLDAHGVDTEAWWLSVQSIVLQMLQRTTPRMRSVQAASYKPLLSQSFTMLRFDFMLDEHQVPYLIEVNGSPGLWRKDAPNSEQLLSRMLVHDLLSLKGLAAGGHAHALTSQGLAALRHHPDSVALGHAACALGCNTTEACSSQDDCMLCAACRTPWQNLVLQRVLSEQHAAHRWLRVHPPHRALQAHLNATGVKHLPKVAARSSDRLVRMWLEAKCISGDFRFC